ncbi:TRAP transporter substrate-binding protein [Uliginosibacterium sp. 31-16]|uniref:TRAP transporter substrate-binding protein n=1 Tax=Uliginosibacterium sp. 31-16 TaxID=3068315 RepID=UPI00273D2DD4|nr:TRAP transporter substrate-binding protein [Uliginosibacterium sp. 31-16]MDP5240588.1 TRAP transporter substrate-binding protein [Uliginosibacterium sp. 31-16]
MTRGTRILIGMVTILALLAGNAGAIDTTDGMRTLRSADVHPDDYPTVQAVQFMNQQIQKTSGRKLGIRVFSSGLLGDEGPLLQLVQSGELDMNRVSIQALDSIAPLSRVFSLPYLFRDTEHLHKVLDGPIGQEVLDSLASKGLIGLAYYDAGIRSIYTVKKPILKLEDMKDLNIRVQPSEMSLMVFDLLGARPVRLPFAQTARALNNDLVEAAENNLPSYSSTEHYKYAPIFSLTRHTMSPEVLVMSKISWDKLSQSEQVMLRKAARESVAVMRDMWQQREERVEATLKLAGVKFNELPKEQIARFTAAVQPVYARYASDPQQQNLIKRIRAIK